MSVLSYAPLFKRYSSAGGTPTYIIGSDGLPVGNNATTVSTSSFDSTGGNFIYIWIYCYFPGATVPSITISDNKSNTYTSAAAFDLYGNGAPYLRLYYCSTPTVGTGHVVTATFGAGARPVISARVYNTPSTYTFDTSNSASGSTTPMSTNAITPAANNCILTTALTRFAGSDLADQPTISTNGWSNSDQKFWCTQSGSNRIASAEYTRVLTTAASNSALHAWTNAVLRAIVAIASFKPL